MKTKLTDAEKARLVREYASQANGSENFYRHGLCRWFYNTSGVHFLAETCGAHWLVDAIASHLATKKPLQAEYFQVWTLHAHGEIGVKLVATDGDKGPGPVTLAEQEIDYSDFPRELLPFRLYCERGHVEGYAAFTLMLPEER
jgi:hypothetical protein